MNIDLCIYRVHIGMHHYRLLKLKELKHFNRFELFIFLAMVIYQAADVEKNPGPGRKTMTSVILFLPHHLPILHSNFSSVHYNVQSVVNKIDIIEPELSNFSLISLTETWLNNTVSNEDIQFTDFQFPFRRDREGDSHGGILVYMFSIKNDIPCKRRQDLEMVNIERLWIEINIKNNKFVGRNILSTTKFKFSCIFRY